MPSPEDPHKRASGNGDGPNTGGMVPTAHGTAIPQSVERRGHPAENRARLRRACEKVRHSPSVRRSDRHSHT